MVISALPIAIQRPAWEATPEQPVGPEHSLPRCAACFAAACTDAANARWEVGRQERKLMIVFCSCGITDKNGGRLRQPVLDPHGSLGCTWDVQSLAAVGSEGCGTSLSNDRYLALASCGRDQGSPAQYITNSFFSLPGPHCWRMAASHSGCCVAWPLEMRRQLAASPEARLQPEHLPAPTPKPTPGL